jgi:GH24 family phage-related lysozyme (muramidase)
MKALFDAVRAVKGSALTQADVDRINAALSPVTPPANDDGMKASQRGLNLIHSFESCKLTAYPDPGSKDGHPWTIGWGSTGPGIGPGVKWTQVQADTRFAADLAKFERGVLTALGGAPVTQGQFDALVSFAYNVGLGALASSTLLRMHKAGDYAGAQKQFARWNKNDGRVMNGLTRRRAAEAAIYGERP